MNRLTRKFALLIATVTGLAGQSIAEVLLSPTDQIIGGILDATNFVEGTASTAAGGNNWPEAEPPEEFIDGSYGGANAKYLNFFELNTGVIITPAVGATVVTSMTLWTANDSDVRDPASYELYGTNVAITEGGPGTTYARSDFTPISSGAIALPNERNTTPLPIGDVPYSAGFLETIAIDNSTSYTSYMLIFPTVKDAVNANSMQVSELAFEGGVGTGTPFVITKILYDEDTDMVTVTWRSEPGRIYALYYSPELQDWSRDVEDFINATPDSETTDYGPFPNPIAGRPDGFFRVELLPRPVEAKKPARGMNIRS